MGKIQNGWEEINFFNPEGFSEEMVKKAKELMAGGFSISNPKKGVSAEYRELVNNNFSWGQVVISYQKSMVSCPFFRGSKNETYILYNRNFQPASGKYFNETARGFATMIGDRIETTMETAIRIIRLKTNLPVKEEMLFRTSCPINTDPSWNNIPDGLSFVACKIPTEWFSYKYGRYSVKNECLIDPKKGIPQIKPLSEFLDFDPKIECPQEQEVECGLSRHAVLALVSYL